ncbi:MAG: RNA 2'-phosphotransferase [Thermoplasmataceae archaeon]|jgi:putative RNA 2'-phosphotransferase
MELELRDCRQDGPFRGKACPVCDNSGKLLMNPREIETMGRVLAGMLRHFPENYGIKLDDHGWVKTYLIVPAVKAQRRFFEWLTPYHIEALARTDPKQRYQVNDREEIRATYGHTIPIEIDDMPTDGIPEELYYQTTPEEYEFIKETGISPSDKTWVHLSRDVRQAYVSGLYHIDSPSILAVKTGEMIANNKPVYRATDEVFLTGEIPAQFLGDLKTERFELTPEEEADIKTVRERRERKIRGEV